MPQSESLSMKHAPERTSPDGSRSAPICNSKSSGSSPARRLVGRANLPLMRDRADGLCSYSRQLRADAQALLSLSRKLRNRSPFTP
jgi:hypothetical protein